MMVGLKWDFVFVCLFVFGHKDNIWKEKEASFM